MSILYLIFVNIFSWLLILFGVGLPIFFILKAIGLTGFREVTRYENYHTFYYQLHPLTKIAFGVVAMIISATTIWWFGAVITAAVALSYLSLRGGRRKFNLAVYLTLTTVVGVTWGYAPFTPYSILTQALGTAHFSTLWTWPSYFSYMGYEPHLTLQSIIYGLQISMRFTAISLTSLILVMTSTPSDILRSLNKFGVPVSLIFSVVVAMRTIPRIFDAIDTSIKIQLMRGLGSGAPRVLMPFYYLEAAITSIVPVFVYILRGARDTAISADTRAFRAYDRRTSVRPRPFTRSDYYSVAVMIALITFSAIAIIAGYGRAIPYVA